MFNYLNNIKTKKLFSKIFWSHLLSKSVQITFENSIEHNLKKKSILWFVTAFPSRKSQLEP